MSIFVCLFVGWSNDVDKEITAMWMLLTEFQKKWIPNDMVINVRSEGQLMRFMGMRMFLDVFSCV